MTFNYFLMTDRLSLIDLTAFQEVGVHVFSWRRDIPSSVQLLEQTPERAASFLSSSCFLPPSLLLLLFLP